MSQGSRIVRSVLIIALTLAAVCCSAQAKRMIPDDNLALPVLVILKNKTGATLGFGSGFYFGKNTDQYLVTAKHVIAQGLPNERTHQPEIPDLVLELISYSKDLPTQKRILLRVDFKVVLDKGDVRPHKTRDVAVIKIATLKQEQDHSMMAYFSPGVTKVEFADSGLVATGLFQVRKFDQVLVGNDAILYGYPASLGLPDSPQFDPLRPLLRRAFIAGKDPQRQSIIVDGPVYRGNSGGPVFQIEQDPAQTAFYLIGIMVEFIPLTEKAADFTMLLNSGYSVAEPIDFALELMP